MNYKLNNTICDTFIDITISGCYLEPHSSRKKRTIETHNF